MGWTENARDRGLDPLRLKTAWDQYLIDLTAHPEIDEAQGIANANRVDPRHGHPTLHTRRCKSRGCGEPIHGIPEGIAGTDWEVCPVCMWEAKLDRRLAAELDQATDPATVGDWGPVKAAAAAMARRTL